ncbi:cupredoxin domain-containing protein [Ktedonobacter robiniae]|uniref:Copper oxidase n=1 Tax=Ktedonobacter robiniae TaxID=2778365 RepID=A0ABQ3V6T3_9CHLR|nr:hypothetical protein [Ktedonobacter robiniae]GHO60951.1 copper oxidase [Ktedonobacter robiniae]
MKRMFWLSSVLTVLWIALLACGGGVTSSGSAQTVQVSESEFSITSSITHFEVGKSYHFTVKNEGKTSHEFMILPADEGSMTGMSMDDMDKMALVSLDNLQPGEMKTLDYTFPASTRGSHPEFACYLTGHYEAGMKQEVSVTA